MGSAASLGRRPDVILLVGFGVFHFAFGLKEV